MNWAREIKEIIEDGMSMNEVRQWIFRLSTQDLIELSEHLLGHSHGNGDVLARNIICEIARLLDA